MLLISHTPFSFLTILYFLFSPLFRLAFQKNLFLVCFQILREREKYALLLIFSNSFSLIKHSVQSLSRVRLCNPMNRSTPGLPVHHQLPAFTETHIHRVGDAIQPSHPLSSLSPPAPNPSQHQSLFQCQLFTSGGQSIGVSASASFLPMNTQD